VSRTTHCRLLFGIILLAWSLFKSPGETPATNNAVEVPHASTIKESTHWSLRPILRPPIPPAPKADWKTRNPIDQFIQAKLWASQLSPSPEAEHRVLVRRLYFDLIGLPPTPEQIRTYEKDASDTCYEKLVDQLLASPHYGQSWASHWLDVVRFAETHGFEMNNPRPNAWPYRDYVIRAFNEDKPYDQFVMEQLAGDVLGEDAATGFLVAGPWDQVKSPDPVLTATQRADELHDIVSTTGSALLGLTVGCARCHDHKFDPIPQVDYYALKGCFEGVHHGDRPLRSADLVARQQQTVLTKSELADVDYKLSGFEPLARPGSQTQHAVLRPPVNPRRNVENFTPVDAKIVRFTVTATTDAEPCIDELEIYTEDPSEGNVALSSGGAIARASSVYPNSELHRIEHLNDGLVGNSHSWISNERGRGWVEVEFPRTARINRVIWGRDREQNFGDRLATGYRIEVSVPSKEWVEVASSADRRPYDPNGKISVEISFAGLPLPQKREAEELLTRRQILEDRLRDLTRTPMAYAGTFMEEPPPTHRLNRGDPMQEKELVAPGALEVVPIKFSLASATGQTGPSIGLNVPAPIPTRPLTQDQQRRLALAKWITDPANPLPARVIVNRLWLYHFGEGLVSTPSDFGKNGQRPSHPELLDWLAAELVHPTAQSGETPPPKPWSLKHLQRLIVTSATFRQSSQARADARAVDAQSRLLWRLPPRRLEAEPLRDAILAVSGRLDCRIGGPGFSVFEPNDNYVRVYNPKQEFGPVEWRRMVYATKVRMQPDATFGAFDCPDGGQIAPKRMRSTTPLQALNLLNSKFMLQQSEMLAARLQREAGNGVQDQVRLAFELLYGRTPEAPEAAAAGQLVSQHGLSALCRALFNSNEFVFLE